MLLQAFLGVSASQAFLLNLCIFRCTTVNSPLATTITGELQGPVHPACMHASEAGFPPDRLTDAWWQCQVLWHASRHVIAALCRVADDYVLCDDVQVK